MADQQALTLRGRILGAKLRLVRQAAGKSLKEAASFIGVGGATLASYESSRKSPSLPELELLAYHLNVPLRRFWPKAPTTPSRGAADPSAVIPLRQRMIATNLRSQRTEAGLSIKELAALAGIPAARLSAYEQADRPIPLPHLEVLADALNRTVEDYVDHQGPVGDWDAAQRALEVLMDLPPDLREFISKPESKPYLRLAKHLSELSSEKLRTVAEGLLDITL
jgi:transcriptional regulator with XRE-family HTH domain